MLAAANSFFDKSSTLVDPSPASPLLSVQDGVGVIYIHGPMLRNPDLFDQIVLGATNTEEIIAAVDEASARHDIQALFLDIDSPGGSVNGTPELAQAVAAASKKKHIYAFSSGQMCSAAYWVASQADAIYATPSARIGSIGVILPVVDSSAAFEQAGLKVEVFAAGRFKSAGTPGTSLTEEQRSWLQSDVEETATDFRAAVLARGRKIPDEAMEGQTFSARNAMRFNMAGIVAGRGEAMERLRRLHVNQNYDPNMAVESHFSPVAVDTVFQAMTNPSIEQELNEARTSIARLESDASARDALLNEATAEIVSLKSRIETLEGERKIEASAMLQTRSDLETAKLTIESLKVDKAATDSKLKDLETRNAALEASEKDIEKRASLRAAQILAETGTPTPAQVTPKGDHQPKSLLEQFKAITSPTEQTAFWQKLSALQQAQILSQTNNH